jgi:hypothetical protein
MDINSSYGSDSPIICLTNSTSGGTAYCSFKSSCYFTTNSGINQMFNFSSCTIRTNLYLVLDTNSCFGIDGGCESPFEYYYVDRIQYGDNNTQNASIFLNNTRIWNYTGEFNTTAQTSNFATTLNTALNNGACDCANCSLVGNNCTIPFIFHSDTAGILQWSNLNITWNESIKPNLTIVQPSGEKNSTAIAYNISATDNHLLQTCKYWITRGASLEVDNTTVTCADTITGTAYVSSSNTNYTFHSWIQDYSGNANYSNSSFSTSSTATIIVAPGGGGGSTTVIEGEQGWSMEVAEGRSKYEVSMSKGTERNFKIQFENLGSSSRTIQLSCVDIGSSICQYVTFKENPFELALLKDTKQTVYFNVKLPEDVEEKTYQFNIIATDDLARTGSITVFLDVGLGGLITNFTNKLFSASSILGLAYIWFFIPILIFSGIGYNKILKKRKVPFIPVWNIVLSLTTSIFIISII